MFNPLNNCVMFLIEILFIDSKKLFVVRQPDGRPLLSSYDLAEASTFIDEHSNFVQHNASTEETRKTKEQD